MSPEQQKNRIEKRLAELKEAQNFHRAQLNAVSGAIGELEALLLPEPPQAPAAPPPV